MKTVNILEARDLLLSGNVVAIPTETVYGLAGWIYSEEGLRKIFSVKERPFFDPLIVHVDTIEKAKKLSSHWTQIHNVLAKACWPGPLTLITKKNDQVNSLISSGLDSVGIRCPRHELTLKLLSTIDGGLAAPSANKFGKTSPTCAQHVFEEFGNHVSILEGGNCDVGIESTVAGVEEVQGQWKVLIYRPGFYTPSALQKILSNHQIEAQVVYAESPVAPGQLKHHYMPNIPLVITPEKSDWNKIRPLIEMKLNKVITHPAHWALSSDPIFASRELYQNLRQFSLDDHDIIIIERNSLHISDDWKGIWNRLNKAKTLELTENFEWLE